MSVFCDGYLFLPIVSSDVAMWGRRNVSGLSRWTTMILSIISTSTHDNPIYPIVAG